MTKPLKAFAKTALDPDQLSATKRGFLGAYRHSVETDPTLADAGVLKVVARVARDDPHLWVRKEAFATIAAILTNSQLGDRSLVETLAKKAKERKAGGECYDAERAFNLIAEKRPELVADIQSTEQLIL